ncbi:MAG: hypothetical protein ACTS7E_02550 [Arsenophonus sp. NC-CH8-MAG3]
MDGDSLSLYDSFNLGLHIGDQLRLVKQNCNSLMKVAQLHHHCLTGLIRYMARVLSILLRKNADR